MAKKIDFIVRDNTTLELKEDASKGDLIDLENVDALDLNFFSKEIDKLAKEQAKKIADNQVAIASEKAKGEIKTLEAKIKALEEAKDNELKLAAAKATEKAAKQIAELEKQLATLNAENKSAIELIKTQSEAKFEKKIASLEKDLVEKDAQLKQTEQQWMHRHMSTKSYGEELEQFIYQEFEQAQQNGAYPNAKFIKDNVVITNADELKGSKGDFIFRDYDDKGNEILSIEIEIKTEQQTNSTTKTHNKDHFAKLDKDRNNKDCEYAILITELEKDNKIYDGIYKVRDYEKMYVVRPQSFLSLINILKDSLSKNNELIEVINQKNAEFADKEQFLANLQDAQSNFNANVIRSQNDFEKAIAAIDDSMAKLAKAKEELVKSGNQLRIANDKVLGITVRKLLKGCKEDPFKK